MTGKEAHDQLRQAVHDYLSEIDNPVPDATMRMILRDRLRALTGAPDDPRLRRSRTTSKVEADH